jgi:hypothetical protein
MGTSVATADGVRPHAPARTRYVRDRLSAVDPLVPVVAVVSLTVYLLHGFDKALTRDLAVYTYGGQRFLEGDPPYVGILNRAGPLAHALPGVGIWLGRLVGLSDLHGARAFYMLIAVGCVCLVYVVVRDLTRLRTAALVAAAAFLGFQGFLDLATNGPREKTPMVLCLLAVFLAVRHRRWATAGVFVALATLIWQPVFFVAVVTAVVGGLLAPRHRLRALLRIAVGGIVPTALVLIYYAANGALQTFADAFFLINAEYTSQPGVLANVPANWASLRSGYGPSLVLILAGLAAMPVPAVRWARVAWRYRDVHAATYVALGAGWLGGLIWCAVAFNGWPDLFVMLPIAAIGVGWAAGVVLRRLRVRAAVAAALTLALAGTAYATVFSVDSRVDDLGKQEASISGVFAAGPPDATVLSMEAPQVLVLTGRTNPTPYQMFDHGFSNYLAATYPGGLGGFLAWIQRTHPTYIVTKTNLVQPWFQPWLEENYVHVGNTRRFRWWVTDTVTKDVRKQIRAAAQAAQEASS